MIEKKGEHFFVSGQVTMAEASALLEEGRALLGAGETAFDLSGVSVADSSALAVLFGWRREARARNIVLKFSNPPANLLSLAEVYGVSDILVAG